MLYPEEFVVEAVIVSVAEFGIPWPTLNARLPPEDIEIDIVSSANTLIGLMIEAASAKTTGANQIIVFEKPTFFECQKTVNF
ncbi:hypothetical protein IJK16_00505 [Candidatus Saccharibacteria bacterium]|jgi:hypothetical protein|nr:hypothetical protein [Candidatus Saccharibacteria bacterium]